MRRLAIWVATLAASLLLAGATVAGAAEWRSEQPLGEGGFLGNLGQVGDVECWHGEANRCLLIAAGVGRVPGGVYAYDGGGWYRYSTVCGGHEGRIAWAGPDEFWTVSDQQTGQAVEGVSASAFFAISLCHFKDGQIIASYGEPIGAVDSYLHMNAAACAAPDDCWFAGARLPGTVNQGAFHLHWNGSSLSAAPSLTEQAELLDPARSVTALAYHQGKLYEGVQVEEGDVAAPAEDAQPQLGPSLLHLVEPAAGHPFVPLFGAAAFDFGPVEPTEVGPLLLSDDGTRLWAAAGAIPSGSLAEVAVLRLEGEDLVQLPLDDPAGVLPAGSSVTALASEPGGDRAWVGFRRAGDFRKASTPARLTRIEGDGTVGPEVVLPADGEGVERTGPAGPVTCPQLEQCWMATESGWLFHLGPDLPQNEDPALHVPVITVRPRDNSLPVVPPVSLPEDDSGAEAKGGATTEEPIEFEEPLPQRRPALYSHVTQRLLHGRVLELSFTLRTRAKVRLLARRRGHVVAATQRYMLAAGRHSLRLALDPKRWPTKLDLQVRAAKGGKR